jgi:hypothetical protein
MKKINDYFDGVPITVEYLDGYYINIHRDTLLEIIKKIQTDTIKETCQACADDAEADITWIKDNETFDYTDVLVDEEIEYEVYVIKSSILKVANKLIKEL